MMNYENQKIGLVLSGGGAKGAYQIGMLRALEEAGIRKEQLVMAGTSIGAINALLYALYDVDAIRKFMNAMSELVKKVRERNTDVFETYCNLFEAFFPDDPLRKNTIPITVCA